MADPTMMQAQDPSQSAATGDESQEQYTVTITANGDGSYTVQCNDSDDDMDNGQGMQAGQPSDTGAQGDDSGPQTANSIDDALKIAGQMLQEEAGEDANESQGDGNAPVSDPAAVWNQLAKKTDAKRQ